MATHRQEVLFKRTLNDKSEIKFTFDKSLNKNLAKFKKIKAGYEFYNNDNTYIKPHFDIDYYMDKMPTLENVKETINNVNEILHKYINYKDEELYSLYEMRKHNNKKKNGDYKLSLHLTIDNIYTTNRDLKNLVDGNEDLKMLVDNAIYRTGQNKFRTLYGKKETDENSKGFLIYNDTENIDIKKFFVSYTEESFKQFVYNQIKKEEVKDENKECYVCDLDLDEFNIKDEDKKDIKFIYNLLDILDPEYYDEYDKWVKICIILNNFCRNKGEDIKNIMYDYFNEFSSYSDKYDENITEKLWDTIENKKYKDLNLYSLYLYAKKSDEEKYKKLLRDYKTIEEDFTLTDDIFVNELFELIKDYIYITEDEVKNKKVNICYVFNTYSGLWSKNESDLIHYITNDLYLYMYEKYDNYFYKNDENNKIKNKILQVIKNNCKNNKKIDNIIDFLIKTKKNYYNDKDIKFDMKSHLFGFKNGVYDLKKKEFRPYKFDDYITINTGYNYVKSKITDEKKQVILDIYKKIMPEEKKRETLFYTLATGLYGKQIQYMTIYYGVGSNAKSTCSKFIKGVLGNYYLKGNINVLCETNKSSGNANTDLAEMNYKRAVIFSEPSIKQKIQNNMYKSLTGDSEITARTLFSSRTNQVNHASFYLETNNKLHFCDNIGDAESRRTILISFNSRFVKSEFVNEDEHFYLMNREYESQEFIDEYRLAFFDILKDYLYKYINELNENIPISIEVKRETEEYLNSNILIMSIINDYLEFTNNSEDKIKIKDLETLFKTSEDYKLLSVEDKLCFKNFKDLITNNDKYKNYYKDRCYIDKKRERNILVCYKFLNNENCDSDTDIE